MEKQSFRQFLFGLSIMLIVLLTVDQINHQKTIFMMFIAEIIITLGVCTFSKVLLIDRGYSDSDQVFSCSIPLHMMMVSYMIFNLKRSFIMQAILLGIMGIILTYFLCKVMMKLPVYFRGLYLNDVEPTVSYDLKYFAVFRNDNKIEVSKLRQGKKVIFTVQNVPTWMGFSIHSKFLFYKVFEEEKHALYVYDVSRKTSWKVVDYNRHGIRFYPEHSESDENLIFMRDQKVYCINVLDSRTSEESLVDYSNMIGTPSVKLPKIDGEIIQVINHQYFLVKQANYVQLGDYSIVDHEGNLVMNVLRKTEVAFDELRVARKSEHHHGRVLEGNPKYIRNEVVVILSNREDEYCSFMQYFASFGFDVICCNENNLPYLRLEAYGKKYLFIKRHANVLAHESQYFDKVIFMYQNGDLNNFFNKVASLENGIALVKTLSADELKVQVPVVEYQKNPKKLIRLLREG